MNIAVKKFEEVMKMKCPICGAKLHWDHVGAFRADCCEKVYVVKPKVVVLIEKNLEDDKLD